MTEDNRYLKLKKRIFKVIQIGYLGDLPSVCFDVFISIAILANLFIVFFETFDVSAPYLAALNRVEFITIIIFTIEYILRLWTSDLLYPNEHKRWQAALSFIFSLYGIVDLLSFLPYYLPIIFPAGIVAFRMLRVVRILRLFRINAYYDAFNVINDVLVEKKNQILSAVSIIAMLAMASSLVIYSLEHDAQPDVFENAFSGIWWAVSTLLTVGYGDIYPITNAGRLVGILLAFLGVGIVAIPTGIISAGFVEQYTKMKHLAATSERCPVDFVTIVLRDGHEWIGKKVGDIRFPEGLILVTVIRDDDTLIPSGNLILKKSDRLALGAEALKDENDFTLSEVTVKAGNEWVNRTVRDINDSDDLVIVMIKRGGKKIMPGHGMFVQQGDIVICYRKMSKL